MSNRGWIVSALTAAAIVVPQQLARESREPTESSQPAWWDSMFAVEGPDDPASFPDSLELSSTPHADSASVSVPQPVVPQQSLSEIFRFDITPESVLQHWPQVWTRFGEDDLSGLRVTLMSGTRPTDLTGSLTYYFDRQHLLQRITFSGSCGDPSDLIVSLQQMYSLQPVPSLGGYQYVVRGDDGQPISGLQIHYAPLIQQDQRYRRLQLELELNRPQGDRVLSPRFRESFETSVATNASSTTHDVASQDTAASDATAAPDAPTGPKGPRRRPADELLPHSR